MNFQLEFVLSASEERRRRLLAEAAQARLLNTRPGALSQPQARAPACLRQRIASVWRGLTQTLANPRTAKWFSLDFNR